MIRSLCVLAMVCASPAFGVVQPVGGQPVAGQIEVARDAMAPERLQRLIAQLDSPSFERRAAAYNQLDAADEVLGRDFEAILAEQDDELSAEQRSSLIELARRRFVMGSRAGLGVQFTPAEVGGGVRIQSTVAGFPASRVLRAGDILVTFDGETLAGTEGMRLAIVSRDPGDLVPVEILRDEEPMQLDVELGSFADLGRGRPLELDPATLANAWQRRLERASFPVVRGPVIDARADKSAPLPRVDRRVPAAQNGRGFSNAGLDAWLASRPVPRPAVVAGGRWTAGFDRIGMLRLSVLGEDMGMPPIQRSLAALLERDRQKQLQAAVSVIDADLTFVRRELARVEAQRQNPGLTEAQRLEATAQSLTLRREQNRLDTRRRELWSLWDVLPRVR